MGKVMESVKAREKEKHLDTQEFIGILLWYIKESSNIAQEFNRAMSNMNEAFNSAVADYKAKEAEKAQKVTAVK